MFETAGRGRMFHARQQGRLKESRMLKVCFC